MNYNQTQISGQSWQRAKKITIQNELNQLPFFEFEEEKIVIVDNDVISKPCGVLAFDVVDTDSFDLLNPQTGEPSGQTMTMAQLRLILTSLYLHKAQERDNNNG